MRKTLGSLSLCWILVTLAGCIAEPPPFNPARMEAIQKEAARGVPLAEMRPLATTLPSAINPDGTPAARPRPAAQATGPTIRLTMQEVIHRTVLNSLDVRVAGYQPAIDEVRVLEEAGAFDPRIFLNPSVQRQYPQGVVPSSLSPNELVTQVLAAGFRQNLTSGGQYEMRVQSTRNNFQRQLGIFNQALTRDTIWDSQVVFQLTQPLLQNFGDKVNLAKMTIQRNAQKISLLDFRDTLEKQIATVEETYWKLLLAQRDVEIQKQLLAETDATLDVMIRRLTNDTTMLQVSQVRSQAEQRNAGLIEARRTLGNTSDDLKRLMSDPQYPVGGNVIILPADDPVVEPVRIALEDQIETALHNRLELMQQNVRISSALAVIGAGRNNTLPQLNLQASVGLEGLGNSPRDSLDATSEADLFNWAFGFQFEMPIGNRVAKAIYQRTLLSYTQAILEYERLAQQAATDVSQAQRDLFSFWDSIDAARAIKYAATDALDQFDKRERAGAARTPELVQLKLQLQADKANAERQEAAAVAQYNIGISALERAKGTLLPYNNIVMKEEKGPATAAPGGRKK